MEVGDAAAMPVIAFAKIFRQGFEDHLSGKDCPKHHAREDEAVLV